MTEDSGTAAPDPRILPIERAIFFRNDHAPTILAWIDAADRAAGVMRVRTDDAAVIEKIAEALWRAAGGDTWPAAFDTANACRDSARAVLEALVRR